MFLIKKIFISFLLILLFAFSSCRKANNYHKTEGMIWNTLYHITYEGPAALQDSILPVLNEVGSSLSVFDKTSLVSRLNVSDEVVADNHLITVYDKSLEINQLSGGRFDPTLSPLIDAWGFGLDHTPSSDTLYLDSLLFFTGLQKTHRENNIIKKDDIRTRFNFSAIAKGYGCDALAEMFKRNGVSNFMIEIGGELVLNGLSPSGFPWKIAVDAPVDDILSGEEAVMILQLTDVGMATSGNYRNYRIDNGGKTAHTISPFSGRPILSEILSATVIASTCMEADALATACMVGNFVEAKELLERSQTEGLLILSDTVWMSSGFKKYISGEVLEPERRDRN